MTTMVKTKIIAGPTGKDCWLSIDGINITSITKEYHLHAKAGHLTTIDVVLITNQETLIEGNFLADINIDLLPDPLAFEIYSKLKDRFSGDRLKRRMDA